MKKNIFIGLAVVVLGMFISLGPQFLFKVCGIHGEEMPRCFWSARGLIGTGFIIAALGICLMVFSDLKIRLGLTIGVLLMGIISLFIPHGLIGGCSETAMACRRLAFPILTVLGILVTTLALIYTIFLERKTKA